MLNPKTYKMFNPHKQKTSFRIDFHLKRLMKIDSGKRPREVQFPLDADRGLSTKPTNGCVKSRSDDSQGNRSRCRAYTVAPLTIHVLILEASVEPNV